MAQYKPAKITTLGQQMMAQDLNNEIDLQFTRIVFGNGTYTEAEYNTLTTRTALKSQKQSIEINQMERKNGTSVLLTGILSNLTLEEGYRMSEIGVYAKDTKVQNATEQLYLIAIADTVIDNIFGEILCADWMPAYNGITPLYIPQQVQIDVVDADETTITPPQVFIVTQPYLEQHYYNKAQTNTLLEGKMNYAVLESISTLSALNAIATDTDYADENYTLIIPIASGNIIANLDIGISETAIMTFHGDYVLLYFPYNNKTFRYSDSATYKWVRVYADVNPADSVVAAMINARHPKPKHLYFGRSIYEATLQRNTAVNNQSDVGRLYLSGTDAVEYVDLESTEDAELINTDSAVPSGIRFIQTWHTFTGEILQRFKVGESGSWSEWITLSPAAST